MNMTIGGQKQKFAVVAVISCSAGTTGAAAAAEAAPRRTYTDSHVVISLGQKKKFGFGLRSSQGSFV